MSSPDVQRNLDPRWLFSSHDDLIELLGLFRLQLRCVETLGTPEFNVEVKAVQAYISDSRAAGSTSPLSSAREEQYFAVDDHSP